MYLESFIEERGSGFIDICRSYQVRKMYVFGSAITDRFDERNSDIDILVEVAAIDPISRGEILLSLWDGLEYFFGRRVDLLTESSIKNPYLKAALERTKKLIYDGEGENNVNKLKQVL